MAHRPTTTESQLRHVEIGRIALERALITLDDLRFALRQVGRGDDTVQGVWVESGVLNSDQAHELLLEATGQLPDDLGDGEDGATLIHYRSGSAITPAVARQDSAGEAPLDPATSSFTETMCAPTGSSNSRNRSKPELSGDEPVLSSGDFAAIADGELLERYVIEEQIGRGGSGRVFQAFDRALGRVVALKVLRPATTSDAEARVERFINEARATGRLEHPNIIPIYDVGLLPNGQAYYTMKLLRRRSLRHVIKQVAAQEEGIRSEYPLARLLHIFLPVCQAVAYAHSQDIVHRDLKPDNIMLGDYGEVLVTDWGLARWLSIPAEQFAEDGERPSTLGTPAYMPPEQAAGVLDIVDELSDIYSLGAILYEILTLHPPFEGPSVAAILDMVAEGRLIPPGARAAGRHVPRDLEEICLRAMAPVREERYPSPVALHDAVVRYLEGQQERLAERKVHLGRTASREFFRSIDEVDAFAEHVQRLREEIDPSASIDAKRPLWDLEDTYQKSLARLAQSYSDAVRAFSQALAFDPDSLGARRGLSDLYWSRFQRAEKTHNLLDSIHYQSLVRQVDREGHYVDLLEGHGMLSLHTHPAQARVTISRYREVDRVLRAGEVVWRGDSPVELDRVEMGSYLVVIESEGYETARYPIQIERCGRWSAQVELAPRGLVPDGFVHVPAGPCKIGGDSEALNAKPERVVDLDDFLIARFPVTFGEYLAFLDELQQSAPEEALLRAPQARDGDGPLAELVDGRWVPKEILIEGEARQRYPQGAGYELLLPILCVSVEDALAYAAWRSTRDGIAYRLPTIYEWEKAGRGVDGRAYPWGDRFDATFCKMRLSRPEIPQPEPVGAFATDESVYGVRDMAGTIQNFCRDEAWTAAYEADPDSALPEGCLPGERPPEACRAGGGSWNHFAEPCRVASRVTVLSVGRSVGAGFRLAADAPWRRAEDGRDDV